MSLRHSRRLAVVFLLSSGLAAAPSAQPPAPGIDDLLNLKRVGSPAISPDGQSVAYTLREANWEDNEYETEIWIGARNREPRQITTGRKSSLQPSWSPDGKWLAFISDRDGKRQIYRIAVDGGEAERLTSADEGVSAFAWAPDGSRIAFTMTDPVAESVKEREKRFGDLRIEDEDHQMAHLYVTGVPRTGTSWVAPAPLTKGAFVVGSFDWSPDGRSIAFDHRVSSDPADGGTADISVIDVNSGQRTPLISQQGPDTNPRWSPDGLRIAFVSSMAKPFFYYANSVVASATVATGAIETITDTFDEDPNLVAWNQQGIFFAASQRTWAYLFRVDPQSKQITRYAVADDWIGSNYSLTRDAQSVAFIGAGPKDFADIYLGQVGLVGRVGQMGNGTNGKPPALSNPTSPTRPTSPTSPTGPIVAARVSNTASQITSWPRHSREVIRWKSQDGAEIEGVLHKPADAQTGRRYPLLVVIHGGPTGISRPVPYSNGAGYYPIDVWLARGALVLEPNYRGSAGYGEKFRSLNVRNLGIGDAWDVISGIDYLVEQGLADRERVGAMGWSQGGYISAFLTTKHSDRFKAVSVGAGISNWMTYYVNTDIHPFTRQYLKATPWDDPKIYAETSPMTYIKSAKTPTLIQHGDQDQRVPVPNAFELYQGLRDQNVPVQLVLFKGFGHPLNKPKANRAAMQQNLDWFDKYLWSIPTTSQQEE
jgi:dipeptidyl aminopeptidase/acylaminoacyl peptidase